jgi:hypothetical protein
MVTPGSIVFWLLRYPRVVKREGVALHWGAWAGGWALRRHMREKESSTHKMADLGAPPLRVSSLTSHRHAPITAVALLSLERTAGRPVAPVLHDDGTMDDGDRNFLRRLFPHVRYVGADEALAALDAKLPALQHPFLRQLRQSFFMMRKFMDAHVVSDDWKVVLDADVFFFRRPEQLLATIDSHRWAHMVDCQSSYGCPTQTLDQLAGCSVHPRLNAGLVHIHSAAIDWDHVEYCARVILAKHGWSYFLEQALLAVLMARHGGEPLDAEDYLVYPTAAQAARPTQVAQHFVDRSSLLLFRHGWRQALALSGVSS